MKDSYLKRKMKGLCPKCGKEPDPELGHIYCEKCLAFYRNWRKSKCKDEASREEFMRKLREAKKKLRHERTDRGECPICGMPVDPEEGTIRCRACLRRLKEWRERRKEKEDNNDGRVLR